LRHVWDLVIQGNVADLESSTKRAISDIEKCDIEFLHLFQQFPNNRFVTRQYSRFARDVLANHHLSNEMIEKSRLLQRGIAVNPDQAHEYGIKTYPNLPERVMITKEKIPGGEQSVSTTSFDNLDDEDEQQELDQRALMTNRIEKVKVPSLSCIKVSRIIMFIFICILPMGVYNIILSSYISGLTESLKYIQNLASVRTYLFQMASFSIQYLGEVYGIFQSPAATLDINLSYFSSWKTQDQLNDIMSNASYTFQELSEFRTYSQTNQYIELSKEYTFSSNLPYKTLSSNSVVTINSSLLTAANDFMIQLGDIVSAKSYTDNNGTRDLPDSFVHTSHVMNIYYNLEKIGDRCDMVIEYLTDYILTIYSTATFQTMLIKLVAIFLIAIAYIITLIFQYRWVKSNKMEIYKCLTSLPKNTVSQLSESLRILKKESEHESTSVNSEVNKQEDNILKIFITGNSNSRSLDFIPIVITSILISVFTITNIVLLANLHVREANILKSDSPHMNYIIGTYSNFMGALYFTTVLNFDIDNSIAIDYLKPEVISSIENHLTKSVNYFNRVRYGNKDHTEVPYTVYAAFTENMYTTSTLCRPSTSSTDYYQALRCIDSETLFFELETIIKTKVAQFKKGSITTLTRNSNNHDIDAIWSAMIFPLYEIFFNKLTETIQQEILLEIQIELENSVFTFVLLVVLDCIVEIVTFISIKSINAHFHKVLKLLLHCPIDVLLQTPKIMSVLSDNFSSGKWDSATRDKQFYSSIVENLPDAVFSTDQNGIINSANKSAERVFEIKASDLIGQNVKDFFEKHTEGDYNSLIESQASKSENFKYTTSENKEVHLEISKIIVNQESIFTATDITQAIRYNTLIQEERQKSDMLLASILPPSLVKRVQAGEKNISFAVQSVTITFIDIVEFTPWCGSLPAEKVMSTLNSLFKKFDKLVSIYPTMTKIKCIGDCYMASGGVFSEINQPVEHASQVVLFGLDAIDAVQELNGEINEHLRIRVGVNTGGPIVAGVLGVGKPTFEILGPTINMAQQMEHHGVPMNVHISRSVYELIYGIDKFSIKERGTIEVKGGSALTYLVTRGENSAT